MPICVLFLGMLWNNGDYLVFLGGKIGVEILRVFIYYYYPSMLMFQNDSGLNMAYCVQHEAA